MSRPIHKFRQYRNYLPNKFICNLINIWHKIRGVKLKKSTVIYPSVKLLRFPKRIVLEDDVVIKEYCQLCACNSESLLKVGKNTSIGFYTTIYSSSSIEIGSDCMIAPFVYIVDSNHGVRKNTKINLQKNNVSPIIIEDDVWIGARSVILPGITIGKGAVIGAGSVVTRNVEPYKIVAGNPARVIKNRD